MGGALPSRRPERDLPTAVAAAGRWPKGVSAKRPLGLRLYKSRTPRSSSLEAHPSLGSPKRRLPPPAQLPDAYDHSADTEADRPGHRPVLRSLKTWTVLADFLRGSEVSDSSPGCTPENILTVAHPTVSSARYKPTLQLASHNDQFLQSLSNLLAHAPRLPAAAVHKHMGISSHCSHRLYSFFEYSNLVRYRTLS